jgi:hypothetical protein
VHRKDSEFESPEPCNLCLEAERAHSTKRQSPPRQLAVQTMQLVRSNTVAACAGAIAISGGVDLRAHRVQIHVSFAVSASLTL